MVATVAAGLVGTFALSAWGQDPLGGDSRALGGDAHTLSPEVRALAGQRRSAAGGRRALSGGIRKLVGTRVPVILFEFGRAKVRKRAHHRLAALAKRVARWQVLSIHVTGHSDAIGKRPDNRNLGFRRARTTCAELRELFEDDRPGCAVSSGGERRPLAKNKRRDGSDNPGGRRLNRRAVIDLRLTPRSAGE